MAESTDRQLERVASDLAAHLLLALEAGHLGTWHWHKSTGETTWDAAMFRLFGLEPDAFEGTFEGWVSRMHPDDASKALAILERAVERKSSYELEHRVAWPDGTLHWIEGRGKVILDEAGEVSGTIGCAIDITERKTAEEDSARRALDAERIAQRESLQRERLEFLVELNDVALHASDHVDLMRRSAAAAVPRLGDWCTVYFIPQPGAVHEIQIAHTDPGKVEWAKALRAAYPYDPDGDFGVPAVMRSGRTQFFRNVDRYIEDPSAVELEREVPEPLNAVVAALHLTSVITVPLLTKRGAVGAMQFASAESGRRYDDDDVALAEAAAGRIAAALDGAWLAEQQRDIARTLQDALLPSHLPDIPGISVAARYWAAGAVTEVGGDFYDVFSIGPRQWAVVIGDVCGTGAEAAAITALTRHTIRAAASHGASPGEVMHWVNDAILREGIESFCTLVYSVLDRLDDGNWRWLCVVGGHPLPWLVRPDGEASRLGIPGTLIGALDTIRVTVVETILPPGATVVLHTDGVNDVRTPYGLTDAQLASLFAESARGTDSADRTAERIGAAIETILPIPERDDDIAVVVLRVL